jgi:hypothetical protein
VTCEAYRYELFPAPPETRPTLIGGDLLERLKCCLQSIFPNGFTIPTNTNDQVQWFNFCCAMRQGLIQYLINTGGTDCQAIARLQAIACPAPGTASFWTALDAALEAEILILFEVVIGCFCSVVLPPCLPPGDPRVPLAAVTVRASDCTIISICDWTPLRKHVVTTKTLGYWFGWLPFVPMIREFMQLACCNAFNFWEPRQRDAFVRAAPGGAAADATRVGAADGILNQPISFAAETYQPSPPISEAVAANLAAGAQPLTVNDLMHAILDPAPSDATAQSLQSTPRAKVVAEVMRPLISAFGPLLGAATSSLGPTGTPGAANAAAMTAMRAELDSLRATVTAQQSAIDALRRAPPNRRS